MYGRRCSGENGQLALMDSLVFFLVAVTVSGLLLFYSSLSPSETIDHGQGTADPSAVLESFLHSSIGSEIVVSLDPPRYISFDTDIGQCLLLEAEAILDGVKVEAFLELNLAAEDALSNITSPACEPYLAVLSSGENESSEVFCLAGPAPMSGQRYSATADLSSDGEKSLFVQLILCPSALPEVA